LKVEGILKANDVTIIQMTENPIDGLIDLPRPKAAKTLTLPESKLTELEGKLQELDMKHKEKDEIIQKHEKEKKEVEEKLKLEGQLKKEAEQKLKELEERLKKEEAEKEKLKKEMAQINQNPSSPISSPTPKATNSSASAIQQSPLSSPIKVEQQPSSSSMNSPSPLNSAASKAQSSSITGARSYRDVKLMKYYVDKPVLRIGKGYGKDDAQFKYPWGVCVNLKGKIIVADNENHGIQIFNKDSSFKTKFGSKVIKNH